MWIDKKIKFKNYIGTVIDQSGDYILVKFSFGNFTYNKLSIKSSQIIKEQNEK